MNPIFVFFSFSFFSFHSQLYQKVLLCFFVMVIFSFLQFLFVSWWAFFSWFGIIYLFFLVFFFFFLFHNSQNTTMIPKLLLLFGGIWREDIQFCLGKGHRQMTIYPWEWLNTIHETLRGVYHHVAAVFFYFGSWRTSRLDQSYTTTRTTTTRNEKFRQAVTFVLRAGEMLQWSLTKIRHMRSVLSSLCVYMCVDVSVVIHSTTTTTIHYLV